MRIKYRYQNFLIGDHNINLRVPINLDKVFEKEKKMQGISREAFPLFGIVWASGEVMAHLMLDQEIASKRVLEIGCGLGLTSLLLKFRDADITAMDIHPLAEDLLAGNTVINECGDIPFVVGSFSDPDLELGCFDIVVGSDILYEPRHANLLPEFLEKHLSPTGVAILVDPDRGQAAAFESTMRERGFFCESWRPDFVDHMNIPYSGKIYQFGRS